MKQKILVALMLTFLGVLVTISVIDMIEKKQISSHVSNGIYAGMQLKDAELILNNRSFHKIKSPVNYQNILIQKEEGQDCSYYLGKISPNKKAFTVCIEYEKSLVSSITVDKIK